MENTQQEDKLRSAVAEWLEKAYNGRISEKRKRELVDSMVWFLSLEEPDVKAEREGKLDAGQWR